MLRCTLSDVYSFFCLQLLLVSLLLLVSMVEWETIFFTRAEE